MILIQGIELVYQRKNRKFFSRPFLWTNFLLIFHIFLYLDPDSEKNWVFEVKFVVFRNFKNIIFSVNQAQESIFRIRECAQSIPHIKLPPRNIELSLEKYIFGSQKSTFFGPPCIRTIVYPTLWHKLINVKAGENV